MIKEYDYLFKLVIIGNSGVGKSSLLLRFSDDTFNDTYLTTIGVDFRFRTLHIDGKIVKLQIWDTAGQERFRTITSAYYKGADGIVLVYDVSSQNSFEDIDKFWINEVESYAEKNADQMLIGNKSDLSDKNVNPEKARNYAQTKKMDFFEVSAKTSDNVNEVFINLSRKLISRKDQPSQQQSQSQGKLENKNINSSQETQKLEVTEQKKNGPCC